MLVKLALLFLVAMAAIAIAGKALTGGWRRRARPRPQPRPCRTCGAPEARLCICRPRA